MKVTRMKTKKMKLFLGMEVVLLIIVSMIFFYIGKRIGEAKINQNIKQVSIAEDCIPYPQGGETDADMMKPDTLAKDTLEQDILLVNRENRLPEDYQVKLLTLPDGVNRAAEDAYEPLCDMLDAGRKEGLTFEICSSYRDVKRQQELFNEDIDALMREGLTYQDAYEEVAKETMPPGCSEHSTGLAFDIVSLGYQMLDAGQEKTAENKWLQEHCAEYGFILRYPKGKEDITAINYESWHYRYVGVEVAEYITKNRITLEEYLEL